MTIGKQYSVFQKQQLNNFLHSICGKKPDFQWVSLLGLCLSLVFAIYTKLQTAPRPMVPIDAVQVAVLIIVLIVSFGLFIYSLNKYLKYRIFTAEYILQEMSKNEVEHDITALIVIKKNFGNTPKILVIRKQGWGYVLPYKKPVSLPFDEKKTLAEVRSFYTNTFGGPNAIVSYLDGFMLEDVIKPNPTDGVIRKHTFGFYTVTYANYLQLTRLLEGREYRDYEWKSVSELQADPMVMNASPEIVNRLSADNLIFNISDSFSPRKGVLLDIPEQLRVIWNITDKCKFNCTFCATRRKGAAGEESTSNFEKMVKIAEELLRIPGVKIDIAGGDPLKDPIAKSAIVHILKYMAPHDVTITSTGQAFHTLDHYEQDELLNLCNHFDVSYDFPSSWGARAEHRESGYNRQNFQQLKIFRERNIDATVLLTLSKHNTGDSSTTDAMLKELAEIKPSNITLLRLMPVGQQSYDTYPKSLAEYDPLPTIERYEREFGKSVKLHCAFRANTKGGKCNMLTEKIGVDHEGNVFACAWAGYLDVDSIPNNPFFLGNLISDGGMEAILKSARYGSLHKAISNGNNQGCKIFSYLESPSTWLEGNHDPLYERFNLANK